jgi:magnesium-transporting ATPase (P-type)
MERWHNLSKEEVLKALESGPYGLSKEQAGERLNKYGRNESLFRLGLFTNRWLLGGIGLAVLLQLTIIYTPLLQDFFYTVPLGWDDWGGWSW